MPQQTITFDGASLTVVIAIVTVLCGAIAALARAYVKVRDQQLKDVCAAKDAQIKVETDTVDRLSRHLEAARDVAGDTTGRLISTLAGIATDSKTASQATGEAVARLTQTLDRVDRHITETGERSTKEHERLIEMVERRIRSS